MSPVRNDKEPRVSNGVKILVLSDTHIPRVAHDLPQRVYEEAQNVDMIIHAGDFVEREVLDKLKALNEVKAVHGNMDAQDIRQALKAKEIITVGKFKIGLIHGFGAPAEIVETVRGEFTGSSVDVIIFGHSHAALNMVKDGILFFNPGSPTDTIFATSNSYGILEVTDKKIEGKIVKL
jgi:hypothetical protein